jgi:hypothetical protein
MVQLNAYILPQLFFFSNASCILLQRQNAPLFFVFCHTVVRTACALIHREQGPIVAIYICIWATNRSNHMDAYLSRQLPVITMCIEFSQKNLGPTPIITPQIDFANNSSKILLVEEENAMEVDIVDVLVPEKAPDYDDDTLDILADAMKNPTKIPKPIGEPGRPRSGGYCLEAALGNWGDELFHAINVRSFLLSDISNTDILTGVYQGKG